MEETSDSNQSDNLIITLFIAKGLALKSNLHEDIDKIYNLNKNRFYEAAINTGLYDDYFFKMNDVETEIYCKKALGIINACCIFKTDKHNLDEFSLEVKTSLLKLIHKGYKRTYKTFEQDNILTEDTSKILINENNTSTDSLLCWAGVTVFLAVIFNDNTVGEPSLPPSVKKILLQAFDLIKTIHEQQANVIKKDDVSNKLFLTCKRFVKKAYGGTLPDSLSAAMLKDFGKPSDDKDITIRNYFYGGIGIMVHEGTPYNCVETVTFEKKDLDDIILSYIHGVLKQEDTKYTPSAADLEKCLDFFNWAIILKAYCRDYVKTKNLFFKNTDLFKDPDELEVIQHEANLAKQKVSEQEQLINTKQQMLNELQLKYDRLYKSKDLLKDELQSEIDSYKYEVDSLYASLRALPGTYLDNNNIPPEEVEDLKVLIFCGRDRWQKKISEMFPKFKFVQTDDAGFDTDLIDSADYVVFNTLYASHGLFYKVINYIRAKKRKFIYVDGYNEQHLIQALYTAKLKTK